MLFGELLGELSKSYRLTRLSNGREDATVTDVRLLHPGELPSREDVLYIGCCAGSTFKDAPALLLVCDGPPGNLPPESQAVLADTEDLFAIFNFAHDLVYADIRHAAAFLSFSMEASKSQNLSAMTDTAAQLMGNAIILIDIGQQVLSHSTSYEIMDALWARNVELGYCPADFVQRVQNSRDMREWQKSGGEMQMITLEGDLQPKLVARILQEDHVVGSAIMIVHHNSISRVHRLFPLIARELFDLYLRSTYANTSQYQDSRYGQVLFRLLDEGEGEHDYLQAAVGQLKFFEQMRIIVARFLHPMDNRFLKRAFSFELKQLFPEGHTVLYKGYIGILVPAITPEHMEGLRDLARKDEASIGISWPFFDIMSFKRYFMQAVGILKTSENLRNGPHVAEFTQYTLDSLLYHYTGKLPLEDFRHPALATLRDYDSANDTALYDTLKVYIRSGKNRQLAAERLFVHRNTLLYRINRIEKLVGLDLQDIDATAALYLSFAIDEATSLRT